MIPASPELILELESRLVNAWPAFEVELAGGWLLRFAEGYSKRANSATPIRPGATLDVGLIDSIAASFETRGLSACFRMTGSEDGAADAALEAAGYELYDPSLGMAADLEAEGVGDPDAADDRAIRLESVAKPGWIAAAATAYGGDKANRDILGRIVRRIRQPAAFATFSMDGQDSAWGLAVAERGYVGLYDIVVAPELRGLGLGRRLVARLMDWGRQQGASRAYLQCRETNEVAVPLYRSLGFATAYRYTHRVPAGTSRLATAPETATALPSGTYDAPA